jgi:ABC-type Fe3+-hydroxamate transport system substrate-binding protein
VNAHREVTDDLGFRHSFDGAARRVVSLVPSLTESVALTSPDALVGATHWCTHPANLSVPRVRGTKNPDITAIIDLAPDLVIANQEENRRIDVERLRAAGVPVWVTVIRTVDEAITSMARLFAEGLGWDMPQWLRDVRTVWADATPATACRVAIPIWRDPWIVVGSSTFTGDLASRLGLVNIYSDHEERYPHVSLADIHSMRPDLVLLPDEPYPFGRTDGPEEFGRASVALIDGRSLTWYGPSLLNARQRLVSQINQARPARNWLVPS